MRAKKYKHSLRSNELKHSLRSNELKHSLRPYGLRRKFFKNIPVLFLSFVLGSAIVFTVLFFSNLIISRENFLLSPLAKVKNTNNTTIEGLLYKNNIQFTKVERSSLEDKDIVYLKDQGVVYIDPRKNLPSQISSLQLILSRLTIEGKKFKRLDLRFDKPIIEF